MSELDIPATSAALTTGRAVRRACREGAWTSHTSGLAAGFAQANLVILPAEFASDFREFCRRNPKPCPLLEVTEPGNPVPSRSAPDADLRTDLPRYRVWRDGEIVAEPHDVRDWWRDDFVGFLLGCSFTFDAALVREGVPVRQVGEGRNVAMYRTNLPCEPVGPFGGTLVVSMRPLRPADAIRATVLTSRFPNFHGEPVHLGLPSQIGIADLSRPDFGDAVTIEADELPVFWACGVTPQVVIEQARLPLAITHSPGCMFVTDLRDDALLKAPG